MSDAEVICRFMEPKPPKKSLPPCVLSIHQFRWWANTAIEWIPKRLTLDLLREVEQKIIASTLPPPVGYVDWADRIDTAICRMLASSHYHWHASVEQKIAALAAVIREKP